jgi:hypothetical protein
MKRGRRVLRPYSRYTWRGYGDGAWMYDG